MTQDMLYILQWWATFLILGIIFLPTTRLLFPNSKGSFYIFSKIIGAGILSYLVFLFGTLKILPFSTISVYGVLLICLFVNIYLVKRVLPRERMHLYKIAVFQEFLFLSGILFWSFVRGNEPSIHGLEKFMDYGFVNSILRSEYFPPKDMWFTPLPINYYFFGHLLTAILTKLSYLPSLITYNLMIATLFAFALTCGFSLVFNFLLTKGMKRAIVGGLLGGTLLSLGGNLHTIYSFFAAYPGEKPVPFWKLTFLPNSFPNGYWYPNATRFISYTIHEFPLYSFVVSDLHGHVLDIPFVMLAIALLFSSIKKKAFTKIDIVSYSTLLAIMYMTNVWDGAIYLLLLGMVLLVVYKRKISIEFYKNQYILGFLKLKKITGLKELLFQLAFTGGLTIILFIVLTLPFSVFFKPFVSGIGIICAPKFLVAMEKVGPFLFEADHCQKSPFYQLLVLYGFFAFFAISFLIIFIRELRKKKKDAMQFQTHIFIFLLILLSTILIFVPEFIYAKDIYPQHYRANTMFKLVYQAFMLLSLVSAYVIIDLFSRRAQSILQGIVRLGFMVVTIVFLILVYLYPYFAIKSYYADLKTYHGIDGTMYLKTLYPGDYAAVSFLNSTISGQPVILEAQGDSYTDYARISANTGLPTVLGWTVHEWLWRGSYAIPSPRIEEVRTMYEGDQKSTEELFKKYHVSYVVVGQLEKQKYPLLNTQKLEKMGDVIFRSPDELTIIYKLKAL